jgi:hypothetical protein
MKQLLPLLKAGLRSALLFGFYLQQELLAQKTMFD